MANANALFFNFRVGLGLVVWLIFHQTQHFSGFSNPLEAGTSLVAIKYAEGVVVGTDSRRTQGTYIFNNQAERAFFINEDICIITTGNDQESQWICERTKYFLEEYELVFERKPTVKNAAHVIKNLCYTAKESGSTLVPHTVVCAGYNKRDEKAEVYTITGSGALVEEDFSANGSGAQYLMSYCQAHYKAGMSRNECEEMVKNALKLSSDMDANSGGILRLFDLNVKGITTRETSKLQ